MRFTRAHHGLLNRDSDEKSRDHAPGAVARQHRPLRSLGLGLVRVEIRTQCRHRHFALIIILSITLEIAQIQQQMRVLADHFEVFKNVRCGIIWPNY